MIYYILLAVAAIILVLVVIVAMQPAAFRITRSGSFAAPPSAVFAQVNDFHNWEEWSPWAKLDLAAKKTFEGPPSGVGTVFTWSGNNQVGEGTMTLTESKPDELIRINIDFRRPFKATNAAEFTFKTEGNQTSVSWSMSGQRNFIFKAFGLFMNMDKLIGKDFEKGLAQLKAVVEKTPA
jgi:uncharacterized protein YndB with AHSA1/START domain